MKKGMYIFLVLCLAIANGLSASAGAAAAAGAGAGANAHEMFARAKAIAGRVLNVEKYQRDEFIARQRKSFLDTYGKDNGAVFDAAVKSVLMPEANKAVKKVLEIPAEVIDALKSSNAKFIIDWLNENPLNKDAVNSQSGENLLIMLMSKEDTIDALRYLINIKPNTLSVDNSGKGVFDSLFSLRCADREMEGKVVHDIIALMIEQGADIQMLLQKAYAQKNEAHAKQNAAKKELEELRKNLRRPGHLRLSLQTLSLEMGSEKKYKRAVIIIDLLEKELEKSRSKVAEEVLIPQYLVKDMGKTLDSSFPQLLAIKHAIEDGDTNKLTQVLENNRFLEIKDATGYTPLLYAAYLDKPAMMRYLIQQGANTDAKTNNGAGVQDFGDYQKLINEERLAREERMEEAKRAENAKLETERKILFENIKHYERRGLSDNPKIINYRDENGYTPLMLAASLGKASYVTQLLYKADTSLKDWDRNTALHLAIINGHFAIANLLLAKMNQESIRAKNKGGFTAYDLAIKNADKYKDNVEFQKFMKAFKKLTAEKESHESKAEALQQLLKVLGQYDAPGLSTEQYNEQLQAQLAIVKPLLSPEQRQSLEAFTRKLNTQDVHYFDYAAHIVALVRDWLK